MDHQTQGNGAGSMFAAFVLRVVLLAILWFVYAILLAVMAAVGTFPPLLIGFNLLLIIASVTWALAPIFRSSESEDTDR